MPAPSRLHLKVIAFALALFSATGCGREAQPPFRIGTNVWPGYEPLYLARDLGYYPSNRIRLVEYTSASEVIRAFRNRAIDAAALTMDEALLLAATTPDLRVILVLDVSHGADVILAKPGVSGLRDLKGRRIGLETGALGAYMLTRSLQTVGMAPTDVRPVSLEISEHERAFREGRVDAVVTFEPVRTKLLSAGARQLFDSSQIPGEIVDLLAVRHSESEQRGGEIELLLRGWFMAHDYIRREQSQAASLMAHREGLSPEEFLDSLRGLRFPDIQENRSMLTGPPPALLSVSNQLGTMMLKHRLIERLPETDELFDGRFIGDIKP
jgi:NitT/TauT family transport system substrate-binding protein